MKHKPVAYVIYTHPDGAELIAIQSHSIQFGYGRGGDGYCYSHSSFECVDKLTPAQSEAVRNPRREGFGICDSCDRPRSLSSLQTFHNAYGEAEGRMCWLCLHGIQKQRQEDGSAKWVRDPWAAPPKRRASKTMQSVRVRA